MEIRQALTFDDVMLVPAASGILPTETDTRSRLTREIELQKARWRSRWRRPAGSASSTAI
jgi:IMP dehydrogenase/GMP reductase